MSRTPFAGHGRTETPSGPVSVNVLEEGLSPVDVSAEGRDPLTQGETAPTLRVSGCEPSRSQSPGGVKPFFRGSRASDRPALALGVP